MDGSESHDKASWTKAMLHTFCDICIKAIEKGMKPHTHFDKAGWKYIITAFKEKTGHSFTKSQLKNKWYGIKKDWRIWKKLISEIGVGWSSELGTISASDEWWTTKIQEIRGARKFRHVGIEPTLCAKYDTMFSNIVATGQHAWAPCQGMTSEEDQGGDGLVNSSNIDKNLEEGSGDSEEDFIPDFVEDVSRMVAGCNVPNSSSNHSSVKRKATETSIMQPQKKRKGSGMEAKILSCLDRLIDSVLIASNCTMPSRDKKGCSIQEVMEELHSIHDVDFGSPIHLFATEFFCVRSRREMWRAMGNLDRKYSWLKIMYERQSKQ